jgi:hypothetical protein
MKPRCGEADLPIMQRTHVILYSPISNEGHLDSWHVLFTELLLRAGFGVLAMTTDREGLEAKLAARGYWPGDTLEIVEIKNQFVAKKRFNLRQICRHAWLNWTAYCDVLTYQRHWMKMTAQDSLLGSLWMRVRLAAVDVLALLTDWLYKYYRKPSQTDESSTQAVTTYLSIDDFRNQIDTVLTTRRGKVSFVLNLYIDAYTVESKAWSSFRFSGATPWAALCITPTDLPEQGYYQAIDYKGTLLLDEKLTDRYRVASTGHTFAYLPDIADVELPTEASELSQTLRDLCGARTMVFLGGSIGKQKNLARWFELIALADPKQWFFVQLGRINKNNLSPDDEAALTKVVAEPPSHLYILPTYLKDERVFNEIISIANVIFAVYRDFGRSSNMLSKAAYFEKPILVAKNGLMGARVDTYKIGLAVEQNDTLAIYRALQDVIGIKEIKNNFKAYRDDFSDTIMQQRLTAFVHQNTAH